MSSAKQRNAHRSHRHRVVTDQYRLRNVAFTVTHDLVRCDDDAFFGWIEREGTE